MRSAFPVLERYAYLNAGTFGPLARDTVDTVVRQLEQERETGRGGALYFETLIALRGRVRARLAEMLGVAPELFALTPSTSAGCQIVLAGLGLRPEDEIVTTDEEHFGLLGPIATSGARVRVAATRGLSPDLAVAAIQAATGPRTRLVAVSHVSWMTGHILPIDQLAELTDAPLLVDGAQSVGAIPVDLGGADFYTVSGQKWLCGPDATGGLYVADPERLQVALPSYFSRTEHDLDGSFEPVSGAARFDAGTIPMASLAGLEVALGIAPETRYEDGRAAARRCRDLLVARRDVVTQPDQATLVSFVPTSEPDEAVAALYDAGVLVRAIPATPWVRVSCGWWTSDDDLARLVDALP